MGGKYRKRIKRGISKNSSLILTGGAVLGLGVTVFFTAKGQMKADDILAERNEAVNNPFDETVLVPSKREVASLTWQCYIPAAISGALTIACIIGSQYINMKQIAGLSASVAFLAANRDQLEAAIKERYGEDALKEIKSKLAVRNPDTKFVKVYAEETGKGDMLCFEAYSGRWFRSNEEDVRYALEELDNKFMSGEYLCLNDLYVLLGIMETHFGYERGWVPSDDYYTVERGIKWDIWTEYDEEKGEDVLMFEPKDCYFYPIECWYEL